MTILVTGFEPFGRWETNPSAQLAERLADVATVDVLPVEFARCIGRVRELLDDHRPDIVLNLGLAPGRKRIEFERVAINLVDACIPDNAGVQPVDEPVVPGGPAAFFSSLPVKAMASAIEREGIPAALSLSAGAYGCNAVLYASLEFASRMPETVRPRCGFVHVPTIDVIDLDTQERAIRAALAAVADDEQHYAAGTIS